MVDQYNSRSNVVKLIFIVVGVIFVIRLAVLQLFSPQYRDKGDQEALRNVTQFPARGLIYDRNGNVTKVDAPYQGSTLTDEDLVAQAKSAAMRAKFDPSPNAAEVQTGTITYNFKRVN